MTRPNLEGLFNGSTTAEAPMAALIGKPTAPEHGTPETSTPAPVTGAVADEPEPGGLFDPVAIAARYFAVLQTLLDMQREFGMRVAHQIAELPGMDRFRR